MKQFILGSIFTAITIAWASGTTPNDLEPYLAYALGGKHEYHYFVTTRKVVDLCYTLSHDQTFENKKEFSEEIHRCIEKYRPVIMAQLESA